MLHGSYRSGWTKPDQHISVLLGVLRCSTPRAVVITLPPFNAPKNTNVSCSISKATPHPAASLVIGARGPNDITARLSLVLLIPPTPITLSPKD
ncbi:hypothetical protein Bpfe_017230 [Biomphalaria pfeifferi]|uniref:Uncharacterized protein n=1 Tax=Biomphalaria pfeifferi TaxID=112525 RepID=A0AAD8F7W9_BIOPF|nr:hypothetical protein Bpfe_017230 [Biomphalaria pfeifferi]